MQNQTSISRRTKSKMPTMAKFRKPIKSRFPYVGGLEDEDDVKIPVSNDQSRLDGPIATDNDFCTDHVVATCSMWSDKPGVLECLINTVAYIHHVDTAYSECHFPECNKSPEVMSILLIQRGTNDCNCPN